MMGTNELHTQTSEVLETSEVSNGFKETELGPIPVDWDVVPLREVSAIIRTEGTEVGTGTVPTTGNGKEVSRRHSRDESCQPEAR
jgi:hypothetical protein